VSDEAGWNSYEAQLQQMGQFLRTYSSYLECSRWIRRRGGCGCDLKQAEAALQASEAELRALF